MNKQKQIEEMEKDIAVRMAMAKGVAGSMNNGVEGWLASYLHDLGYRKIPKNAVVLTREEYQWLTCCFGKFEEIMNDIKEQTRKETVEKFAERLKEKLEENSPIAGYDLEDLEFDGETIQECIDEICKEIAEDNV